MTIGIDVSQTAYRGTGVANSTVKLVSALSAIDKKNKYILFFSSLRKNFDSSPFNFHSNPNVIVKKFRLPPKVLNLFWNKLHILPIELFIGKVDVFISSDWVEPPTRKAKKATFVHDLVVYKFPKETDARIIETQKKKLNWATKECSAFFCPSQSTKKDIHEALGIPNEKIHVVRWGV